MTAAINVSLDKRKRLQSEHIRVDPARTALRHPGLWEEAAACHHPSEERPQWSRVGPA